MRDGLTHYLHFLYPDQKGYLAIQELDPTFQSGGVYAVPVDANGNFFSSYSADYIKHSLKETAPAQVVETSSVGKREFEIEIGDYRFKFKRKGPVRPYIGKLEHPDFLFGLVEVEPPEGLLDAVFNESRYLIVGCSPFHYREVDTSK